MRQTHTYTILEVSPDTYAEIRRLLQEADYEHTFYSEEDREVIDMNGIALSSRPDSKDPRLLQVDSRNDQNIE